MNHYFVCADPLCKFVLDVRVNGEIGHSQILPKACPLCGGKWTSNEPLSRGALNLKEHENLPPCSCCSGKTHQTLAHAVAKSVRTLGTRSPALN